MRAQYKESLTVCSTDKRPGRGKVVLRCVAQSAKQKMINEDSGVLNDFSKWFT